MPNLNTYTVAGISFYRGAYRLRTSNNLAERQKTLMAMGDTDINLIELPRPMTKTEIVLHLSKHMDFDSEEEKALLAQLRAKWRLDKPAEAAAATPAATAAAPAPCAVQAAADKPWVNNPDWEPDF